MCVWGVWEILKVSFVVTFYIDFTFLFLAFLEKNVFIQCVIIYK